MFSLQNVYINVFEVADFKSVFIIGKFLNGRSKMAVNMATFGQRAINAICVTLSLFHV